MTIIRKVCPCEYKSLVTDQNSYSCVCKEGFTGEKCETNIDECEGVICKNNGTCKDGINSFSCICAEGFTGDKCETAVYCSGTNCGIPQPGINSDTCVCPGGLPGPHCELKLSN